MVIFNSTTTHNERVCVSAVNTGDFFVAVLLKRFCVSSCGTGRISRGLHGDCSSLSASSAEDAIRRTPQTKQEIAHGQTTAMYSFPRYSFISTLTEPFQFFSEAPNRL